MKLTASGVANWAAITRSPSFSRSSPSQTTTMWPRRISSTASSTGENGELGSRSSLVARRSSVDSCGRAISVLAAFSQWCHQALHVLADHVALHVEPATRDRVAEVGVQQGLGDQRDLQPAVAEAGDGETDAVEGDRAALDHLAVELGVELHPQ